MAFTSKNPRARKHLLVLPKAHIPTIAHVTPRDLSLLLHMLNVGQHVLSPNAGDQVHIPAGDFEEEVKRRDRASAFRGGTQRECQGGGKLCGITPYFTPYFTPHFIIYHCY